MGVGGVGMGNPSQVSAPHGKKSRGQAWIPIKDNPRALGLSQWSDGLHFPELGKTGSQWDSYPDALTHLEVFVTCCPPWPYGCHAVSLVRAPSLSPVILCRELESEGLARMRA